MSQPDGRPNGVRVLVGVGILITGLALLAERLGLTDVQLSARLWPVVPLALGCARLADPPRRRGAYVRRSGGWLIWVGLWGLVSEFHVLGLDYSTSWPVLVIGIGFGMIWRAVADSRQAERDAVQGS